MAGERGEGLRAWLALVAASFGVGLLSAVAWGLDPAPPGMWRAAAAKLIPWLGVVALASFWGSRMARSGWSILLGAAVVAPLVMLGGVMFVEPLEFGAAWKVVFAVPIVLLSMAWQAWPFGVLFALVALVARGWRRRSATAAA